MLKLLAPIFASPRRRTERAFDRIIELAIDKTVAGTDPRIRSLRGYRKRLREAVEIAVRYVVETIAAMPAPIQMGRDTFARDPQVHAFFATVNDLCQAFSADGTVRAAIDDPRQLIGDNIYVGLATTMTEKPVFAPALVGDAVHRDVARTTVSFSEPRCDAPSASESDLR